MVVAAVLQIKDEDEFPPAVVKSISPVFFPNHNTLVCVVLDFRDVRGPLRSTVERFAQSSDLYKVQV